MLKDKLVFARNKKGLNQEELAKLAGVSRSTIANLEIGKNTGSKFLVKIAEVLDVPYEWLSESGKRSLGDSVSIYSLSSDPKQGEVDVPVIEGILYKEDKLFFLHEKGEVHRFSEEFLKENNINPDNVKCIRNIGNSMLPVLPDKCKVGFDTSSTDVMDGKIYLILNDGLPQIKILKMISGSEVSIESFNEGYEPVLTSMDKVKVIGRVFWYEVVLT